MLTRQHAIADYDFQSGQVLPDRLTRVSHGHYVDYAERMLRVYRMGVGRTRQQLHRAVWAIFDEEDDCPGRRIEAFCKLLDDVSAYASDSRGRAAALRREVFHLAAEFHPLVRRADRLFDHAESDVKTHVAERLGRPWAEIDDELFADVIEFHRLARFDGYPDAPSLLARYNVAQVQTALFDAVSMAVWTSEDFKTVLRYAKLARLMHTIHRAGPGRYRIRLDGPASVLRETRRYGVAMARFLPALIACRGWRMHAVIRTRRRGWELGLDLQSDDGLTSHLPEPDAFDSRVEESFAGKWGAEPREGWSLVREGEVLHHRQRVFVPDFVFRHEDGRTVLMEIVGFWTPEYLRAKVQTLATFRDRHILLAVAERAKEAMPPLPQEAITFKTSLHVNEVLQRLKGSAG